MLGDRRDWLVLVILGVVGASGGERLRAKIRIDEKVYAPAIREVVV